MVIIKKIFYSLTRQERLILISAATILVLSSITRVALAIQESSEWVAISGGAYYEGVLGQPIAINPIISNNQIDQDISRLIYSNLSDLVENYEVKQEGRAYILKLKENLSWDNGQPLTSDDVIFTIETVQNPDSRSPLTKDWRGVVAERISELRISLTISTPYTFFLENIERLPIIPAHIFGKIPPANLKLSSYNFEPVGSGPYRFEGFTKRKDGFINQYHLTANDYYYDQKPFIKDFYFVFYEDYQDLINDFLLRKVDGFGSLLPQGTEGLPPNNVVINQILMPSYYAIFFNSIANPELKKDDFRYALTAAINKRRIIQEVLNNQAESINGPLGNFALDNEDIKLDTVYNPEKAREKLSTLNNEKIEITLIIPKIKFLEKTAKIVREDWLSIGVDKVNIISLLPDELLDNVIKTNNYEALLFGNILENPLDLFPFWHSSQRFYPGLNLALYKNSEVDSLIEIIRQTEDENEQKSLAKTAEELIVEERSAIFLFSIPYTYIHTKNLGGFEFENNEKFIITPSDRFKNVSKWHVSKARVLK